MLREFIYSENWLDQLFQNKNKMYGAYQLRRKNADNTFIAFIWSMAIYCGIGLATYTGYKIYLAFADIPVQKKFDDTLISYDITIPPKDNVVPSHPPRTNGTKLKQNNNTIPLITDSTDNTVTDSSSFNNQNISNGGSGRTSTGSDTTDTGGSGTGTGVGFPTDPPKPIRFAEKRPEFPGGDRALVDWLSREIKYPEILKEQKKEGIVYIEFVVSESGKVSDAHILREVRDAPQFTEEAIRAINKMPLWIPGEQNGHKVPVYFALPINFQLR